VNEPALPRLPGLRAVRVPASALDGLAQSPVRFDALVGETDDACLFVKTVTMDDAGVAAQRVTPTWPHHLPGELVISLTGEAGVLTLRHKRLVEPDWRGHGVRITDARFSAPVLVGETAFMLASLVRLRRIRQSIHTRFRFRMWKVDGEGCEVETYRSEQDAIFLAPG
jgi:hypothetical protein